MNIIITEKWWTGPFKQPSDWRRNSHTWLRLVKDDQRPSNFSAFHKNCFRKNWRPL